MKTVRSVIFRIILIIAIGAIPFLPAVTSISQQACYYIAAALAIVYIYVGIREVAGRKDPEGDLIARFSYLPSFLISKRIIRIAIFLAIAVLLMLPGTRNRRIQPMVQTVWVGELIFFLAGWRLKKFSILFYTDSMYFIQEKETRIFSEEIKHVEYRYDIVYLVLKNGGTIKIDPDFAEGGEQEALKLATLQWLVSQKAAFTAEAVEKLKSAGFTI